MSLFAQGRWEQYGPAVVVAPSRDDNAGERQFLCVPMAGRLVVQAWVVDVGSGKSKPGAMLAV